MAPKKKTSRSPKTVNKDNWSTFNAKTNVGNKILDSVKNRESKFPAFDALRGRKLISEGAKALKEEGRTEKAGKRMAAYQKSKKK